MKSNVTLIPAKKKKGNYINKDIERKKLKVAAYCRVSTEQEEQQGSFDIQVKHYTELINANPEWELADIYADDGISGTSVKNRKEFMRMIDDCMAGKIDLVITKSISRFARNTLDCLKYVRMLKDKNIGIKFEKENIYTLDASGELLLTIMASLAQQESQSLSQNVRMGYQFRFQQGKSSGVPGGLLGYESDGKGGMKIVPEEAKTIKRIYKEFLEGYGAKAIAKHLEKDGVRKKKGSTKWYTSNIQKILVNEKYMGDSLLQKTMRKSILDKRSYKNDGSLPQYYVTDSHEGIISKDVFLLVQEEIKRRNDFKDITNNTRLQYSGKYAFSSKIFCGKCGGSYLRDSQVFKEGRKTIWKCATRIKDGKHVCDSELIKEDEINDACLKAINSSLKLNKKTFDLIINNLKEALLIDNKEIKQIEKELNTKQEELLKLVQAKKNYSKVANEIADLNKKKDKAKSNIANSKEFISKINDFKMFISKQPKVLESYDENLIRKYIKKVTIFDDHFEFEFTSSIKISINRY